MSELIENWKTQIRKGYLELCILTLIRAKSRLYGFDILDCMEMAGAPVKEGTLYPLLNRMAVDGYLASTWETEQVKGHPRKFYSLTPQGTLLLSEMEEEFARMNQALVKLGGK